MRNYWWSNVLYACVAAVLGRDAEALDALERINDGLQLPQMAFLQDSHCFQRFKDGPRYQAVLASLERRKKQLRDRLPQTLRDFGVGLR